MTIRITDPEVPRALPVARLYLDDIEQIINVLSSAERKARHSEPEAHDQPSPSFQVGNRCTHEIEDLPKITKRTSDFTLRLGRPNLELVFQVDDRGLRWWSAGLTHADAWETFHKLEAIIKPKSSAGSGRARGATILAATVIAGFLATKLSPRANADTAGLVAAVSVLILSILITERLLGPASSVVLRYSYDQAARREERNSKLLFAVLGWALGIATTLLGIYVKHKFWP
jgi:hypothetical protein